MIEDVLIGMLAGGVNKATICLLVITFVSLVVVIGVLGVNSVFPAQIGGLAAVVGAVLPLILLSMIAWFVHATGGTVTVQEQKKELKIE